VQRQHELGLADVSFVDRKAAFHLVPELDQLTPDRIAQFDPEQIAAFMIEPAISKNP